MNTETIKYGTVLKVKGLVFDGYIDTVMLVYDLTNHDGLKCKLLDLRDYTIVESYKDIEDFINKVEIVKILIEKL